MKLYNMLILIIAIATIQACRDCEDIEALPCGDRAPNSEWCGWAVTTFYAENENAAVGRLYDTRLNESAPLGADWGTQISSIQPTNWTKNQIGQVFGTAIDKDNNIYLGATDMYRRDNSSSPFPKGQIFKATPLNNWEAQPFVVLPNNGGIGNGIGNIVYDKNNDQLFASNLEDGKIYRISMDNILLDNIDPFNPDDGSAGLAFSPEAIYAIGINVEDGIEKLYYVSSLGDVFSVEIQDMIPVLSTEQLEFTVTLTSDNSIFSDMVFTADGNQVMVSEFSPGGIPSIQAFDRSSGNWQAAQDYFVGNQQGNHAGGGLDLGPRNSMSSVSGTCDAILWSSGTNMTPSTITGEIIGLQAIDIAGNRVYGSAGSTGNEFTDIYVDFDGLYVDPCDVNSSLIQNADFEELTTPGVEPSAYSQLDLAANWQQATLATSDFFSNTFFDGSPQLNTVPPPNESDHFAGGIVNPAGDWVEYIGACLTSPIIIGETYSCSMLLGNSDPGDFGGPPVMEGTFHILGIPDCNFPIATTSCADSQYEIIGSINLSIPEGTWQMVEIDIMATQDNYPAVMFSLGCEKEIVDHYMVDDIIITEGMPCDSTLSIINLPGDVEIFDCTECLDPCTLSDLTK